MDSKPRTNQEWIDAITGRSTLMEQNEALTDLANYLFIVVCNHLAKKSSTVPLLRFMPDDARTALAQEFVQEFMEKMIKEEFALLAKFGGYGRFLSWSAQVAINICNSELRRLPWRRTERLENRKRHFVDDVHEPESVAFRDLLRTTVGKCLANLPERHRYALVQCVIEGQSASDVGDVLDITANAVHLLVFRAKKKMQKALLQEGIGTDLTELLAS